MVRIVPLDKLQVFFQTQELQATELAVPLRKTQEVTLTNMLGHSKHLLKLRKRFEEQVALRVPSYSSVHDDSIPPLHESVKGHLIGVGNTAQ